MPDEPEQVAEKPEQRALVVRGTQVAPLIPTDFDGLYRMANILARSGMTPKGMTRPETVFTAIQMGLEIGLAPMQAVQSIAVINGRPTLWGDALLAVVQGSGLMTDFREEPIMASGEVTGFRCIAQRAGYSEPSVREFTLTDAKRAGLLGKSGPWTQYQARMLQMRARSWALRDTFADVLKGMVAREEAQDFIDVEAKVLPVVPDIPDVADLIPQTPAQPTDDADPAESSQDSQPTDDAPPVCPDCGAPMVDNRDNRKAAQEARAAGTRKAPPPPAWRCSDDTCGGAIWPAHTQDIPAPEDSAVPATGEVRDMMLGYFARLGVSDTDILAHLGLQSIDEMTTRDIDNLRDVARQIKAGARITKFFPAIPDSASGGPDRPVGREKAIAALEQLDRGAAGFEFLDACKAAGVDQDNWRAADEAQLSAIYDAMKKGE